MTELASDGVPVTLTYRVSKVSRQLYYRWLTNPITDSEVVEAYRASALFDAHQDDRRVRSPTPRRRGPR